MAVIRNAANRVMRGKVGEFTYYVSNGQQIARQALNNSNFGASASRTDAQQSRRVMWANLVNFYKLSRSWMPKAYENKSGHQTDYNKFMQINTQAARVALTKSQAVQGACVIDAYQITQGSIPTISVNKVGNVWASDLSLGALTIDENTTIAEFTEALIAANPKVQNGMQLSFVSYQQDVDALSIPHAICTFYEVTLSLSNSAALRDYLPAFCSQVVNGYLGTNDNISLGGFAYILSNQVNGKIFVSSQSLVLNNAALITQYTSSNQVAAAIESYGVSTDVVLSPVSTNDQERVTPPLYISILRINNIAAAANTYYGTMQQLGSKSVAVTLSTQTDLEVTSITAVGANNTTTVQATGITKSGREVTGTFGSSSSTQVVAKVIVTMSDGTDLVINFATEQSGDGEDLH